MSSSESSGPYQLFWEADSDSEDHDVDDPPTDSDSDSDYQPVDQPTSASSTTSSESRGSSMATWSSSSSPDPDAFRLLSDPFSDRRPHPLPLLVQDFPDVHPEVLYEGQTRNFNALDCFRLFVTRELVELLCVWTNARADKFFADNAGTHNRRRFMGRAWVPVTVSEFFTFLALQLLMGVHRIPKI